MWQNSPPPFLPEKTVNHWTLSIQTSEPSDWDATLKCNCMRCHAQQHFSFLTYDICFFNISVDQNKSSKFASLILLRGKAENNMDNKTHGGWNWSAIIRDSYTIALYPFQFASLPVQQNNVTKLKNNKTKTVDHRTLSTQTFELSYYDATSWCACMKHFSFLTNHTFSFLYFCWPE